MTRSTPSGGGVSGVARDLDFLRDEERAPLAYDDARYGFHLTDETYTLPPVRISRKEAYLPATPRRRSTRNRSRPSRPSKAMSGT